MNRDSERRTSFLFLLFLSCRWSTRGLTTPFQGSSPSPEARRKEEAADMHQGFRKEPLSGALLSRRTTLKRPRKIFHPPTLLCMSLHWTNRFGRFGSCLSDKTHERLVVNTSREVSTCFNFHVSEQLCDRGAHFVRHSIPKPSGGSYYDNRCWRGRVLHRIGRVMPTTSFLGSVDLTRPS